MNVAIIACLLVASIGAILLLLTRLLRAGAGIAPEAPPATRISASRLAEIHARVTAGKGALAVIRDATEDGGIRFSVQTLTNEHGRLAMDYLEHALEDYADLATDLVAARAELQARRRTASPLPVLRPEEVDGLEAVSARLVQSAREREAAQVRTACGGSTSDATQKALAFVARQEWELSPLAARYRTVGPSDRVARLEAAGLPLEFEALSVGLRAGGPQVALIPLDESSEESARAIEALPQLVRNAHILNSVLEQNQQYEDEEMGLAPDVPACSIIADEDAREETSGVIASPSSSPNLTKAALIDAHAQTRRALRCVGDVGQAGYLAGGASWSRQSAEERLVEAKAHLERALKAQEQLIAGTSPADGSAS